MPQKHIFHPLPKGQDNGAAITELFKSSGPGTTVFLLPQTTYVLHSTIDFVHPHTTLATLDLPSFETGRQAIIETRGEKEAVAVNMFNKPYTSLRRIHVRGCRGWGRTPPATEEEKARLKAEGKLGWVEGGGALIWMGGPESEESLLEGCRLEDPRGWTGVHVTDHARRAALVNNIVGPCGQEAQGGPWADGMSIAGRDSLISGNTVIDATDGAIVIFCAPGSLVTDNTIIARGRDLLGGINMVDDFPFDRDFEKTKVVANTIRSEGAFIRLALGIGPTCWSPWQPTHTLNYGGSVVSNIIGPGTIGYGIALSGAKNFTVLDNNVAPGTQFTGSTHRMTPPMNAPPMPFLREYEDRKRVVDCKLQDEFVEGEASWLIGIEPGRSKQLIYEPGQLDLDAHGRSLAGEGGIALQDGTWLLRDGGLAFIGNNRQTLWFSGSNANARDPVLTFSNTGSLAITDRANGSVLWDPTLYLHSYLECLRTLDPLKPSQPKEQQDHAQLTFAGVEPYLSIRSADGNIIYRTAYEWTCGDFELRANRYIAIAPAAVRHTSAQGFCPAPPQDFAPPPYTQQGSNSSDRGLHHHHGGLSSFVRDVTTSLQQTVDRMTPPTVPPRNSSLQPARPPAPYPGTQGHGEGETPAFLFIHPVTHQIIVHTSPSPMHPRPHETIICVPPEPMEGLEDSWLSFQYDGNLVYYAKRGEETLVRWASNTGGAKKMRWFAPNESGHGSPAHVELYDEAGNRIFTSAQ